MFLAATVQERMTSRRASGKVAMSRKPAYLRIAESLRNRIEARELEPGDKLPPERVLVDQFGVARMTVRHALDILQLEGIIERKRGRSGGTFVRALPPVVDLNGPVGLAAQLEAHGVRIRTELLFDANVDAPQAVKAAFGVDAESETDEPAFAVLKQDRLHYADDVPAFSEVLYVRPGREAHYATSGLAFTPATRPAATTLREDLVAPGVATEKERERLGLAANTPLQRVTRKLYERDVVVAYSSIVIRPDVAQLRAITRFD